MPHFLIFAFIEDGPRCGQPIMGLAIAAIHDGQAVLVGSDDPVPAALRTGFLDSGVQVPANVVLAALRACRPDRRPQPITDGWDVPPLTCVFAPWFRAAFPGGLIVRGPASDEWDWETARAAPDRRFLFGWPLVDHPDVAPDEAGQAVAGG